MLDFTFHMPTRIIFGAGRLAELGRTRLPGRKALVVISAGGSMRRTGHLDKVLALLAQNGCATVVFDKIQPNPVLIHVAEGAGQRQPRLVLGLQPERHRRAQAARAPGPAGGGHSHHGGHRHRGRPVDGDHPRGHQRKDRLGR